MMLLAAVSAALALPASPLAVGMMPDPGWHLVGFYDATAVGLLGRDAESEPDGYVWRAAPGMEQSCGPAKSPVGLGVFEAEAMANGLAPTLAVVLERTRRDAAPLAHDEVRVELGDDDLQIPLQPALAPRHLIVEIAEGGELALRQLVRTQLETRLCMEHKVGRAWTGGRKESIREAFLLDPASGVGDDRMFFGGQKSPVPALVGPSDACLAHAEGFEDKGLGGGRGQGDQRLVPSDVWGASLRWCTTEKQAASAVASSSPPMPIELASTTGIPVAPRQPIWHRLSVSVNDTDDTSKATVDVAWDGRALGDDVGLFEQDDKMGTGLVDVLAMTPYLYPTVGPAADPDRYTVLLVPNWQVVEALRRVRAAKPDAMAAAGDPMDGVGWLLAHPSMLKVQVGRDRPRGQPWPDLASALASPWSPRNWGFTVGMDAGRAPVAVPGDDVPGWEAVSAAQRVDEQAAFLACGGVLVLLVGAGTLRLRELWTPVPEERAAYWPGATELAHEPEPEAPEVPLPGAEG